MFVIIFEKRKGPEQYVFAQDPKLRDAFLQDMFDHANMGGLQSAFTDTANMKVLWCALREAIVDVLGDLVTDVLITDLAR